LSNYAARKKKLHETRGSILPIQRLLILLYMAETEINQRKDDGKIKRQINLDRYGLIPVAIHHPPLVLITDHISSYWPKFSNKEIFMGKTSNLI
jgi:hypothetical protein